MTFLPELPHASGQANSNHRVLRITYVNPFRKLRQFHPFQWAKENRTPLRAASKLAMERHIVREQRISPGRSGEVFRILFDGDDAVGFRGVKRKSPAWSASTAYDPKPSSGCPNSNSNLEGDKFRTLKRLDENCCIKSECMNEPFRILDRDPAVQ